MAFMEAPARVSIKSSAVAIERRPWIAARLRYSLEGRKKSLSQLRKPQLNADSGRHLRLPSFLLITLSTFAREPLDETQQVGRGGRRHIQHTQDQLQLFVSLLLAVTEEMRRCRMNHLDRRAVEYLAQVDQPCRVQLGKGPLIPRKDGLVQPDHHAHLSTVQPLGVATLSDELTERLLHLIEASYSFKSRFSVDGLFGLIVARFEEPMFVDIRLHILYGHGDRFSLLLIAPRKPRLHDANNRPIGP
jgi:hypothetical protein